MQRTDEPDPPVAHDVALPAASPATTAPPPPAPDQSKPFVDDGQTSRSTVSLGVPTGWKVAWNSSLNPSYPFRHVLAAGQRILLIGRDNPRWQLFDDGGRELALGGLVSGDALLDAASRLFYLPSPSGSLEAHHRDDGALAWRLILTGADDWARVLISRRGARLIAASYQQALDPHGGPPRPNRAAVEVHTLGAPDQVKESFLQSFTAGPRRDTMATRLQAVIADDKLVVAVPGLITFGGLDLGETATYTGGTFEPLALSADDHGAFLVVRDGGRRALWHLSHAGKRTAAHLLPDDGVLLAPPVIGADGTAHVLVGDRVLAFTDAGAKWSRQLPGLAGATATADGKLLAAAGSDVLALDGTGAMVVVQVLRGEKLVTAPLLARGGRILVASAGRLFALEK